MKLLIKMGGALVDDSGSRGRLAQEIRELIEQGHRVTVVHGGGKQMTRFLQERGVESRFVNGLRVTTPEVIDAVLKVFAGTVNHELVVAMVAAGIPAVGLSGLDASLTIATPLAEELGAVGKPERTDARLLDHLCGGGYLPVVACVAGDGKGAIFNVNADQMAVSCATAFCADALLFLTDVAGVLDAEGRTIPNLTPAGCDRLIREGLATGGMQAKLEACKAALAGGIGQVLIGPGSRSGVLRALLAGEELGTRIATEEPWPGKAARP